MKRGFTLVEVLVASGVLLLAALVLVTSYSSSLKQATQTRERQLALIVADNLLERVRAHPYGKSRPIDWGTKKKPAEESFFLVIDGREVQVKFETAVDVSQGGNSSFFGLSEEPFDRLQFQVRWREPRPDDSWETKMLDFEITVWRQTDVQK